ncbi:uncharacterized protein LOC108924762 isoform X2 [Scleropages formosus]|uniref:uncharacterized protein LOC108924762 isoform X2 n=1 Tax=Scleropages formosus TaxID=113540 RepID=UPI0008783407|nr:uncharacterized protein LOC108924762 isoform X2 [Scleropages formosus]
MMSVFSNINKSKVKLLNVLYFLQCDQERKKSMVSDKESGTGQRELCPFCGRPFKRLKTHLPHCKMAPVAKATKSSVAPSESRSPVLEHAASERRTTAVMPEGFSNTDLTGTVTSPAVKKKSTRLSVKTVVPKVSPNKNITPKNLPKFDLSSGPPKVKPKVQEQEMMKTEESDKSSRPGGGREVVSAQKGRGSASLKTDIHSGTADKVRSRESTKKGQRKRKAPDTEMQQTCMPFGPLNEDGAVTQKLLLGSLSSNGKAEGAGRELRAQEMANSRSAPAECHIWGHKGTKTDVWDHIKNGLTGKSCRRLLTADLSEAALGVGPAFQEVEPQSSPILVNQAGLLSKQRPENLFPRANDGSAPCHNPAGALWEPCGRGSRVAGLEWTPELATSYRGIGFSMLPLWCPTEHVQRKPPPVQPIARQVQGSVTERALLELRLAELPTWLMSRPLPTPRQGVALLRKAGWQWYHSKYVDVRRGAIGGVAMLLAGCCVLSYLWSYPDFKHERWRKYH